MPAVVDVVSNLLLFINGDVVVHTQCLTHGATANCYCVQFLSCRYYLFLQLRRDLHHGRLLCSPDDAVCLASFIVQCNGSSFITFFHKLFSI